MPKVAWHVGWLLVRTWPVPSALPRSQIVPSQVSRGRGPSPPLDEDWEKEAHQTGGSFPAPGGPPSEERPLAQLSPAPLRRWGQHCAPAPAPPAVHHAPGGPGRGCRSRRHQLCLRGAPQLLQLLGQLHEPGGTVQPHEPCQQRSVSSGRRPRPSAQGPIARCPPPSRPGGCR